MRSIACISILISCLLLSARGQIASPTNKGAELPDDYRDALNDLEKDIGSGHPASREPKKLHKRANSDELKRFKSQVDDRQKKRQVYDANDMVDRTKERYKKRKGKGLKGETLSPEEIQKKTDEELRQLYYAKQKDMDAQMNDVYQKVSDKLKAATSDEERDMHMKKKEMIEKRKKRLEEDNEMRAQRYVERMRKRADAMQRMGEEL